MGTCSQQETTTQILNGTAHVRSPCELKQTTCYKFPIIPLYIQIINTFDVHHRYEPVLLYLPDVFLSRSLQGGLWDHPLRIHLSKALHLLCQATVAPLWPLHAAILQDPSLKVPIKLVHKPLPSITRLALRQVRKNPLALFLDIRLNHLTEPHSRVAPDLLHTALVECSDGFLVVPVTWRRVEEDALPVLLVSQLDDELALLVTRGAVREALETAGYELCAGRVSGRCQGGKGDVQFWLGCEGCGIGVVGCERAPFHVAEEVWLVCLFDAARQVFCVAVVIFWTSLGRSCDKRGVLRIRRVEDAFGTFELAG